VKASLKISNNEKEIMTEIYFIRHGESVGNKEERFRGQRDFALNEEGLKQAWALQKVLKKIPFVAVYSSPLKRALQTAVTVAMGKVPVIQVPAFTNICLGPWENRLKSEIRAKYPDQWRQWTISPERLSFPGMESLATVQKRSYDALLPLVQKHDQEKMAIVSHRAVLKPLFAAMMGIPEPYFWKLHIDTASFSIAEYWPERGFMFTGLNINYHLETYHREDLG